MRRCGLMDSDLTNLEWEILEECAGRRKPRAWGAAVGAALSELSDRGYVYQGTVTRRGVELLRKRDDSSRVVYLSDWRKES